MPANPLFDAQLQIGRVVRADYTHYTLDIALLNGAILTGVQMLSPMASKTAGSVWLPNPTYGEGSAEETQREDVYAVVGFIGGQAMQPMVLGFVFPEVSDVLGLPAKMYERYPNGDHLVMERAKNSVEHWFSDGSFFRIAENNEVAHYVMTRLDTDKRYGDKGGGTPRGFFLSMAQHGSTYRLWRDGLLEITHPALAGSEHGGNVLKLTTPTVTATINTTGQTVVVTAGTVTLTINGAAGTVAIVAPNGVSITGNLAVSGTGSGNWAGGTISGDFVI